MIHSSLITQHANLIGTPQFEEDLNWCIEKINNHFIARPYWEESITTFFTRGTDINKHYWEVINKTAIKRITESSPTLLYSEAYREFNRMAFFAINIIITVLDDMDTTDKIDPKALEEILQITHQALSVRAPDSLSKHDDSLKNMQKSIDIFCAAIDTQTTNFVYYSNKMNNIRIAEADKTNDNSSGKRQL
jgi:hypothetical protein